MAPTYGGEQMRFDGRVVIVTGAGRGIGRAEALLIADRGASVVVNDLGGRVDGEGSDVTPAEEVVAEIVSRGGKAVASGDSVATPEGAAAIVGRAIDAFGRVDAVVNNAGILDFTTFPEIELDEFQRQLDVHLIGAFNVTRAAWPHMARAGYGRVVMTTSTAGLYGIPETMGYAAGKAGVLGLTRALACLGDPHGIRINALAPGAATRMTQRVSDESFRSFSEAHRDPSHVAPITAVLAHESCQMTGEIFFASAGRVARIFLAETLGFCQPGHEPEDLLANWDSIVDESGYLVPADAGDNLRITFDSLQRAGVPVPDVGLQQLSRTAAD